MGSEGWEKVAQRVRAYRDQTIKEIRPELPVLNAADLPHNVTHIPRQVLTSRECKITETLPEVLLERLATGKLSSVEVTRAFLRRAGLAQQLANCVTEVMVQKALERAQYLDSVLQKTGSPVGPLHGLPISVKEHIAMEGLSLNCGFVAWADKTGAANAQILDMLYEAGAVYYVRTNQPQILMHLETNSVLFGPTLNPYHRQLTAGGSSGGEGALLGLRGSCLGIGTDIGGSIRSPAGNCGVWGFRPSSYRLPNLGAHAPGLGEEQIIPVIVAYRHRGPMSTSLAGLNIFMKAIIDQKPWLGDPAMLPFKWNTSESHIRLEHGRKKLKIAILWHDGVVKPHPPVTRALKEVSDKLRDADGISLVEWVPHKHAEGWNIISGLYFCDGGKEDFEILEAGGEPLLPLSEFILKQPNVPKVPDTATEIWRKTCEREAFKREYNDHWNATGSEDGHPVDAILCPVGPGVAPPLDHARYWAYTSTWNLLDYPALVFPYSFVDQEKDKAEENFVPMSEQDAWNHQLYTPNLFKDAPISLQLVCRRYEDEKVFEIMELIQRILAI